jgi:hypothetical protein
VAATPAVAAEVSAYPGADPLAGLPRGVLVARLREAEAQVRAGRWDGTEHWRRRVH